MSFTPSPIQPVAWTTRQAPPNAPNQTPRRDSPTASAIVSYCRDPTRNLDRHTRHRTKVPCCQRDPCKTARSAVNSCARGHGDTQSLPRSVRCGVPTCRMTTKSASCVALAEPKIELVVSLFPSSSFRGCMTSVICTFCSVANFRNLSRATS